MTATRKRSGWRWPHPESCGTTAAYRRHRRHGENACESCLQAVRRDKNDRMASKRIAAQETAA